MATGSYMTPIYSRSQNEVQRDLHKVTSRKSPGVDLSGDCNLLFALSPLPKLRTCPLLTCATGNAVWLDTEWNGLHALGDPARRLHSRRTSPVQPRNTPSPAKKHTLRRLQDLRGAGVIRVRIDNLYLYGTVTVSDNR
ncbi:hypothetical protein TNCV_3826451 [Trichonephila clavipes]|nr:hypothetical protein TNCV_3826451 [Trichonephila clavipes]